MYFTLVIFGYAQNLAIVEGDGLTLVLGFEERYIHLQIPVVKLHGADIEFASPWCLIYVYSILFFIAKEDHDCFVSDGASKRISSSQRNKRFFMIQAPDVELGGKNFPLCLVSCEINALNALFKLAKFSESTKHVQLSVEFTSCMTMAAFV